MRMIHGCSFEFTNSSPTLGQSRASPFAAAIRTGHQHRSSQARRSENAVGIQSLQPRQHRRMRLRRSIRHHVFRERLPRVRWRLDWIGLHFRKLLAIQRRRRNLSIFNREQWLARSPIQHIDISRLRNLCHRFDRLRILSTVTRLGAAGKSRSHTSCLTPWKCQIRFPSSHPAPARNLQTGYRQCDSTRKNRTKPDRLPRIPFPALDRYSARPKRWRRLNLIRILRPCLITELARLRNGVKNPANLRPLFTSNARICPGDTRQCFRHRAAQDHHVLINHAGTARAYRHLLRRPPKPSRNQCGPFCPKLVNRLARAPVERPK